MTIALLIKVNDGIVLASDSATTLLMAGPDGNDAVGNTYNNANKVFNLHKGVPVGAMTWGLGNIGPASIATLAKDLRRRFQGQDGHHPHWAIDPENYAMSDLAASAATFLNEGRYEDVAAEAVAAGRQPPGLGFLVAGYSSETDQPTAHVIQFTGQNTPVAEEVLPDDSGGASWWGQPEAISRLLTGMSMGAPEALANLGLGLDFSQAQQVVAGMVAQLNPQMVPAAMPIQDAIDLAEFLVHATIQYVRFSPGPPTVGGPIEIATITKHEGFKWVRRKHFFDARLNPTAGR